jgi:SAM-dependent methyltransferase
VSENPVRDLHDAVARSGDPVIASTRPATTKPIEMRRMVSDVISRLRPEHATVLDLGCGTGVLGEPIARLAARYVGVDVSPEAVAVLRERLPGVDIRCADVLRDDLSDLGAFDRVLVYAVLHYVTSEAEGELFLRKAIELVAPGGFALFGNLPLPAEDLPHTTNQRLAGLVWSAARRLSRQSSHKHVASIPAGYCLSLTRPMIDGWLEGVSSVRWSWVVPRLGTPLQRTRADLIVEKMARG